MICGGSTSSADYSTNTKRWRETEFVHPTGEDTPKSEAGERTISLGARIAAEPLPWIVGGFVLGMWLGSSRR